MDGVQIRFTYWSAEGRYQTEICRLEDPGICFPSEFAQDWILRRLPSGASVAGMEIRWVSSRENFH